MNYVHSEIYRLRKNRFIPIFFILTALLIVAADMILMFFDSTDANFPYGHTKFFYSNVLGLPLFLYLIGYMLSSVLLGKDKQVIRVTVASGIKRETVFWSKLLLSGVVYLAIGILLTAIMLLLGENTLSSSHDDVIKHFIIAMVNMLPILFSAFVLSFVFNLSSLKDANGILIVLIIYIFSGGVLRYLAGKHVIFEFLYTYSPSGLLEENLMQYMIDASQWMLAPWIIGALITILAITISLHQFKKADL